MSSDEISLIASEPFVRKFVYAIIQNIKAKNFDYNEKHVVHAGMVPKLSEKVMQASLREKMTPRIEIAPIAPPIIVPQRRDMSALVAPRPAQQISAPSAPQGVGLSQDYGRITPLLNDPSVSTIECHGEGKPLMVIRAGQKQGTRISLTSKEIKEILHKVSDVVHIPLLEGVFRAAVDNFSINAVISEMIGSRFIIKKQTAYALLEK